MYIDLLTILGLYYLGASLFRHMLKVCNYSGRFPAGKFPRGGGVGMTCAAGNQ